MDCCNLKKLLEKVVETPLVISDVIAFIKEPFYKKAQHEVNANAFYQNCPTFPRINLLIKQL